MIVVLSCLEAEVNVKNLSGLTALMWAAERNHPAVVKLLLEHQAEPNAQDSKGFTGLSLLEVV